MKAVTEVSDILKAVIKVSDVVKGVTELSAPSPGLSVSCMTDFTGLGEK